VATNWQNLPANVNRVMPDVHCVVTLSGYEEDANVCKGVIVDVAADVFAGSMTQTSNTNFKQQTYIQSAM